MKNDKFVVFRENSEIIQKVDEAADKQGVDRSAFIRQSIRLKLHSDSGP